MPVSYAQRRVRGPAACNEETTAFSPAGRVPSRGVDGSTDRHCRPPAFLTDSSSGERQVCASSGHT